MTKQPQPAYTAPYDPAGHPRPYYLQQAPAKDRSADVCLLILAIIVPFWTVFIKTGCSGELFGSSCSTATAHLDL
jgi:hypothetical protein